MPRYIYPPRPRSKIKPEQLDFMEKQAKYLWQPKFDGDRCVCFIENDIVYLGNRHGKWRSILAFSQIRQELLGLKLEGQCYLDGELVSYNNEPVLILFDVLQIGSYLVGVTQTDRLLMLDEIAKTGKPHSDVPVIKVSDHIWVSIHGDSDFASNFSVFVSNPILEGLVLREKTAILSNWGGSEYEVDWQIRCRRPHKNYRF